MIEIKCRAIGCPQDVEFFLKVSVDQVGVGILGTILEVPLCHEHYLKFVKTMNDKIEARTR